MKAAENLGKKAVREFFQAGQIRQPDEPGKHNQPNQPNHRGRGQTPAEKKQQYQNYQNRKKFVYEKEKKNQDHLILFLASDGENPAKKQKFYILGGNSAIIYAYEIAARIGKKRVNLRPDLDLGDCKFREGICLISDLELLAEKLKTIGIERAKITTNDSSNKIVAFKLSRKYAQSEIRQMLKVHQEEVEKVNQLLYPTVLFPDIHQLILVLKKDTYHKVMRLDKTNREVLEDKIIMPIFRLGDLYTLMAHGDIDIKTAKEELLKTTHIMMDRVKLLQDLNLWDTATCAKIGKHLAQLELLIKGRLK